MTSTSRETAPAPPSSGPPDRVREVGGGLGLGLVAGVFSGLLGVGGGLVIVPGMVLLLRRSQHVAHATSLAAIVPTAVAGVAAFGKASAVDWKVGALLAVGSIPGARAGAVAMNRVPAGRLRTVFGVFVIAVAFWLLFGA